MSADRKRQSQAQVFFSTAEVLGIFKHFEFAKNDLYYYEDRKECLGPRPSGGREAESRQSRSYSPEDLERLSVVIRCVHAGFSLNRIMEGLKEETATWLLIPPRKLI